MLTPRGPGRSAGDVADQPSNPEVLLSRMRADLHGLAERWHRAAADAYTRSGWEEKTSVASHYDAEVYGASETLSECARTLDALLADANLLPAGPAPASVPAPRQPATPHSTRQDSRGDTGPAH